MQRLSFLESLMAGGFIFGIAWVILMGASVKSRVRIDSFNHRMDNQG